MEGKSEEKVEEIGEVKRTAPKILFVDEDLEILEGFKRVLFKMRKEWEMEFASSGEEALRIMEKQSFNAVVSNIGLSVISGMELFEIIREKNPGAARIFISGNTEMKQAVEALGTAHQFLTKPVDPQALKKTLTQVISLRNYLNDDHLEKIVKKVKSLPSRLELQMELLQAIASSSIKEIGKLVEKDPAMTARVLQLVNSSFFGIRNRIDDIYQAITLIGVDILKALALSLEIFSKFPLEGPAKKEMNEIFSHSVDVANYARLIAMEITKNKTTANESYWGGLLHDVGKLIILTEFPDAYFEIKDRYQSQGAPFRMGVYQIENEVLGVSHSKLGAYLLGLWGLPEVIVETVAYHHNPEEYSNEKFSPVTAAHIADAIKRSEIDEPGKERELPPQLNRDYLGQLDLMEEVPHLTTRINEEKRGRNY
jgi:putative nucleotidyltransferase with HDIG domain